MTDTITDQKAATSTVTVPDLMICELEALAVKEAQARASDEARRLNLDSRAHAEAIARHLSDSRRELGLDGPTCDDLAAEAEAARSAAAFDREERLPEIVTTYEDLPF